MRVMCGDSPKVQRTSNFEVLRPPGVKGPGGALCPQGCLEPSAKHHWILRPSAMSGLPAFRMVAKLTQYKQLINTKSTRCSNFPSLIGPRGHDAPVLAVIASNLEKTKPAKTQILLRNLVGELLSIIQTNKTLLRYN